ncbi:alcohol-forming fatty acyl-CoA reductase-like [Gossypium australe]|uniref:Alcohol-forming fatty acyl-CoA reductase-like n=1 Tax=Gossypium australe TaxID=47621 RepID=A0A5B6VCN3_9ROSI|nr:alcohol-forming fatty acyl-CoA reductase-like [Gossypium australe]
MALLFHEFDVILGMDWLSKYGVIVDYKRKRISLRTPDSNEMIVTGENYNALFNIVSVIEAFKMVRKGYTSFLTYNFYSQASKPKIEEIVLVRDYPNVFPEELPGLPPEREVKFGIEVVLGMTPIPTTPYQMAPIELKELKAQLQELVDVLSGKSLATLKTMNVYLKMELSGRLIDKLRIKPTLLQRVKDAQKENENMLMIKKQLEDGKNSGFEIDSKGTLRLQELNENKLVYPDLIKETKEKVKIIRDRLKVASDRKKSYVDLKSKEIEYSVGEKVFLKVSRWKKVF